MNQIESIQQNIHFYKLKLNTAREVICKDEIDKINNKNAIIFYLAQLKALKSSLSYAVKQLS